MSDDTIIAVEVQEVAAAGLRIFPVGEDKHPHFKNWPKLASCDPAQLAAWACSFQADGHTGWGVLTGPENRLFVVDIDLPDGQAWVDRMVAAHGDVWLNTRAVATGREAGGFQYYYLWPADGTEIHSTSGAVAPGVDVKGWHGVAVLPPTPHKSGRRYAWLTALDHPILPAPDWLLEIVIAASKQSKTTIKKTGEGKILDGTRGDTIFRMGSSMRAKGFGESAIRSALLAENADACSPPMDEGRVEAIVNSIVTRYEQGSRETHLILNTKDAPQPLFQTVEDFVSETPATTKWTARPYLSAGGMSELVGKIKAAGKTTFAMAMTKAVLDGASFLGQPCSRTGVVYLSEQTQASLRQALARAGLLDGRKRDLFLMQWHKTMGLKWSEIAAAATEKAVSTGSKLLVVDTLHQFAALMGSAENDSGAAMEVLRPLQAAQEKGIAVLVVRHERKGDDSQIADAARGSSAFGGAVDVMMRLRRGANYAANLRLLECLSRFDETPQSAILELEPTGGYVLRNSAAVTFEGAQKAALAALPTTASEAKTIRDLMAVTGHSRTTLQRVLGELQALGLVERLNPNAGNCAYRFYRAEGDGATCQ